MRSDSQTRNGTARTARRHAGVWQRGGVGEEPNVFNPARLPKCARSFPELDPRLFSFNSKHGWCPSCYGTGLLFYGFNEEHTGEEAWWNEWFEGQERPCPECRGTRLRREAVAVRFQQKSIADFAALSVEEAAHLFAKMKLRGREAEIARDIVAELRSRLEFLKEVRSALSFT